MLAPYLAGLDTEDDGNGNPFLWCVVHETGTWSGESRDAVLAFLEKLGADVKGKKRQLEVWATNLEYDLVNTFDPDRIPEVSLRFGRSSLCGARWRGIEFRDTIRHLPISVAQFGELVGLKKLEGGLFEGDKRRTFAAYLRRCMRDAAITFRAARFFHRTYQSLKVRPRMTLASTALALWRDEFWRRPIHRPDEDIWNAARAAYYGGRTQAFAVGTFRDVKVIDASSMFPWAMCAGDLPLPWGLSRVVARGAELRDGLYRARVTSDLRLPRLPVRTVHGLVYPNGSWVGWYVGEELRAFTAAGGRAQVLEGFEFSEHCRPFDEYIRTLFELKQAARGAQRLLYKTLMNGLYGKTAQLGRRVHAVPIERLLEMPNPPLDWRPWNGLAIYSEEHAAPPWSNFVWPAIITARARMRLASAAERIMDKGGRLLYCDTDSLMYLGGDVRFPKSARHVGDFELRGRYRQAVIVGKKEYALEVRRNRWDVHAKGVPFGERERYLREGVAEFSRPVKIRESTRIGVAANVWRKVTKHRRTVLRGRKSDGALQTPIIRQ